MSMRAFATSHSRTLKAIPLLLMVALLLGLSVYECMSGGSHIRQFVPHEVEFSCPRRTSRYRSRVRVCLRQAGGRRQVHPHRPASGKRQTADTSRSGLPGNSLVMHRGRASILSPTGRIAARPGDWVRVSFTYNVAA